MAVFDGNPFPDIANPGNRELRRLSNLGDERINVCAPRDATKRTKARINHVVNVVLDCFVGPNEESDHILRNLVNRLLRDEPKTAAQLLMRLMPKQIEMEVEANQRILAGIVLVDKTSHPGGGLLQNLQHQDEEINPPILVPVSRPKPPKPIVTPATQVLEKQKPIPQFPNRPLEEVSPAKAKLVAYLEEAQRSGKISQDNPILQEMHGILSTNR